MENWLAGPPFQWGPPMAVPEKNLRFDGRRCSHVRQLFKRFDLDPHNLRHWHVLIWHLAGNPKRRPRKWDSLKLHQLRLAVELMKRSDPQKNDTSICQALSKNKAWKASWKTLRRKLQDARKPATHQAYEGYCDMLRRALRERLAKKT